MMLEYPTREEYYGMVYRKSGSKNSKDLATYALSSYDNFLKSINENEDAIFNKFRNNDMNDIGIYNFLNKIISYWIEAGKSTSTVRAYMSMITSWLTKNGILLMPHLLKQHLEYPKKFHYREIPIELETIQKLIKNSKPMYKVLIMVLVVSGLRVSEALNLKKSDVNLDVIPGRINVRAETTKGKEDRETYVTEEVKKELLYLCHELNDNEYIFSKDKSRPGKLSAIEKQFHTTRKKLGLNDQYSNGRFIVHIHGFRKYFFTRASLKNGDSYAHAITGHHAYLDEYFVMNENKRSKLYLELSNDLTIFQNSNLET